MSPRANNSRAIPMPEVELLGTPKPPPVPQALLVARYEDLTLTEMAGQIAWFRLSSARQFNEAFRALQVALDLEHFIAVVPIDPQDFTPENVAEILSLRRQTEAITGQFIRLNCLGETSGDDDRIAQRNETQRHIDVAVSNA